MDIDAMIQGQGDFPAQVKAIVHSKAIAFTEDLAVNLRERGIDLHATKAVFAGEGAILLRPYIEQCEKIGGPFFIEDIKANVKGYELMYSLR